MATKIGYDKDGKVVAIDSETGQKDAIGTMENLISEVEERRKLREKARKLLEKKHPTQ